MNRRSLLKLLPKVSLGGLFAGREFFKAALEPVQADEVQGVQGELDSDPDGLLLDNEFSLDNIDDSAFVVSSSAMAYRWTAANDHVPVKYGVASEALAPGDLVRIKADGTVGIGS